MVATYRFTPIAPLFCMCLFQEFVKDLVARNSAESAKKDAGRKKKMNDLYGDTRVSVRSSAADGGVNLTNIGIRSLERKLATGAMLTWDPRVDAVPLWVSPDDRPDWV